MNIPNTKYLFKYTNLPISLSKANRPIHYSCFNLKTDAHIEDLILLSNLESETTILSNEDKKAVFSKYCETFKSATVINLQSKPPINFFKKLSYTDDRKMNQTIAQVFGIIIGTEKFYKIIYRMLNSYVSSNNKSSLQEFLTFYLMKPISLIEFPVIERMKIVDFFENKNPQFLNNSENNSQAKYYYGLDNLSKLESEVYSMIIMSRAQGAVFLDFKSNKNHSSIFNGYFFHLKDSLGKDAAINFNPMEESLKRTYPASKNSNFISGGIELFNKKTFKESVPFIFRELFKDYRPVESLYSLIDDPNLSYFMYENNNHLICILNGKDADLKTVKQSIEKFKSKKHISLIYKDAISLSVLKRELPYASIEYYEFLMNNIKNIVFTYVHDSNTRSMYIEVINKLGENNSLRTV